MGSRGTLIDDQSTVDNTPEDVAALYSWAHLQGAKYRDYSASRRVYRAQVRYRAAKALLERELTAQAEAEASAEAAEQEASAAEATARFQVGNTSEAARTSLLRSAETATKKAAGDRVEAARRAEAAAHANVLALREKREITEAHLSARLQALTYTASELRRRELAGPQPSKPTGNADADPVTDTGQLSSESSADSQPLQHSGLLQAKEPAPEQDLAEVSYLSLDLSREKVLFDAEVNRMMVGWPWENADWEELQRPLSKKVGAEAELEQPIPAWLYASQATSKSSSEGAIGGDMLQNSQEQVGPRWFALQGVFEDAGPELPAMEATPRGGLKTPILAVISLAGGVGKTSLVATLGRVLSSLGEKVALLDTTPHGLLPFLFRESGLHPGELRSFSARAESEPIPLAIFEAAGKSEEERRKQMLAEEIFRNSQGKHRVLLDLSSGWSWLVRQMVDLHPTVLIPMAPDTNSPISLEAMERVFYSILDSDGQPLLPFYVLNQFDAANPLHLEVREVFRRQLGDRLLRFAIRHSPAVSEALAEGMTVVDYVPAAPVSQDYLDLASWLRDTSPPATAEFRNLRWDER